MSHKKMIWKEFKRAGILDSQDEKVRDFVQYLKGCGARCWEEIIPEFKTKYYDCFDAIVPTLAEMDDPLIQMVLVDHADMSKPKEKALVEQMAQKVNPERNPVLIKRMANFKVANVTTILKNRTLPEGLRKYVLEGPEE